MAIRIVKEEPAKEVLKEVVCQKCGCTLEYAPIDVEEFTKTDYTGCKDTYRYIDCPKCKHRIYLR